MYQPIAAYTSGDESIAKRYASDSACCNNFPAECQYDVTIPTSATVNNIKFKRTADGAEITKTFTASGATAVVAAIRTALTSEGYEDDNDVIRGVTSKTSGSNTIYSITGSLIIVSMTHSTSTVVSATAKCKRAGICDYTVKTSAGATNNFGVDGVVVNLGNLPFDTTTAAALKTAIESASNFPAGYTVTVTKGTTQFTVVLNGPGTKVFTWNGVRFDKSNCVAAFIA